MTEHNQARLNTAISWLNRFDLASSDPKWSSAMIERFIQEVIASTGSTLSDVFEAIDRSLHLNAVELTRTVAAFVKETVVTSFTQHRQAYNSIRWNWANDALATNPTSAECYLFLHALPPECAVPKSIAVIMKTLQGTEYEEEARVTLEDDLNDPAVKALLV